MSTSSGPEGTTSVSPGGPLADPGAVGGLGALGIPGVSSPEGTTRTSNGGRETLPDGSVREELPNGLVQTTSPDGVTSISTPDGAT
ncbi:hypothetical protein ACWD04_31715, partial [Streptomyces sp. NPDC002911]